MHTEAGVAMGTRPYMSAGQARYATSDNVSAPADSLHEHKSEGWWTLTFPSWNQIRGWLRRIEALRRVA
jgi:hypothetical protein